MNRPRYKFVTLASALSACALQGRGIVLRDVSKYPAIRNMYGRNRAGYGKCAANASLGYYTP